MSTENNTPTNDESQTNNTETPQIKIPIKRTTGDTLEERLTDNAYHNILPARYLKKDKEGNLVEDQEDLFKRVGNNVALAEAVYELERKDETLTVTPDQIKPEHHARGRLAGEVFGFDSMEFDEVGDLPKTLENAQEHLLNEEVKLTEENVNKFAYETIVPELPDDVQTHVEEIAEEFTDMHENLKFVANSPTLMNAGDDLQQLSACFVNSPDDDMDSIHETAKEAAKTFQSGGGMGYAFWKLRPKGDPVGSSGGISSGPITFMNTYDQMCETVAQGGTRRGAQMGVMRISHPDVLQFIHAKNKDVSLAHTLRLNDPDDYTHTQFIDALNEARELIDEDGLVPPHLRNAVEGHLSNFNISVGVTDEFMEAYFNDEEYTFTNPRTGEPHIVTPQTAELYEMFGYGEHVEVGEELSVPATKLWEDIIHGAHENGEPGVIYLERVNKKHSFDVSKHPQHRILATNPCGEQPLEEYEACNLGHINFSTLVAANPEYQDYRSFKDAHDEFESEEEAVEAFLEQAIDWDEFDYRIEYGTRFLENVVTMSDFPIDEIEEKVSEMRKIGLGIMGYAQMLVQLGIQYGSEPANEVARQMMTHMNHESKQVSQQIAVDDSPGMDRGVFGEWDKSKFASPEEYQEWFEHHTGEDAEEWSGEGFPLRNHNTTTIAPTGCVAEDTLVSTTDGLQTIDSVESDASVPYGQWSETEGDVTAVTDTGEESVGGVYDNSLAEVKTIDTEQGFSVSATPNHRFRVLTSAGEYTWREAGEFEVGDNIVMVRNTFSGGSDSEIDSSELDVTHHNTDEDLCVPDVMTDELAEFLGYYMGDGYVHERVGVKYVVDSSEEELEEYLIELSEDVFGVTPTVEDKGSRKVYAVGGRHLPRIFDDNGWTKDSGNTGEGSASAFIPEEVLSSSESVVRSFLSGLFEADGCASTKVELSTVSETLASQVQTALLGLGCVFVQDSMAGEDISGHYGERTRYTLRGANKREDVRFSDEVGFITKEFDGDVTNQSFKNDSYPPAFVEYVEELDGFDDLPSNMKKRVRSASWNGSLSRRAVRDVEEALGEVVTIDGRVLTDLYVATVSSVEDDMAYTRDMEVPSTNTYTANGFVSHNTTSMVGNTTGGCEPMFNVAYMKNVSDDVQGDEMLVEFDDYFLRVLEANDVDIEPVKEEAQELMQANEFEGAQDLETVPDELAELFITTSEIDGVGHASVQCAFQDGVDSSISKTCNFPNEATKDDMREVYEYIYKNGGKGVTVYRDGTRSKQVLTTRADNTEFSDEDEFTEFLTEQVESGEVTVEAIVETLQDEFDVRATSQDGQLGLSEYRKRPDALVGINQRINTGYGTLYVWISEGSDGNMFEVFASIGKAGGYTQSFTEALCRMISMSLRYGVPPKRIVRHLSGIQSPKVAWENQEQVASVADGIAMAMDNYLEYDGVVGLIQELRADDSELGGEIVGSDPPSDMDVEGLRSDVDDAVENGEGDGEFEVGASVDLASDTPEPEATKDGVEDSTAELVAQGESPECPECGDMQLYYSEGCKTCESCGWSEC